MKRTSDIKLCCRLKGNPPVVDHYVGMPRTRRRQTALLMSEDEDDNSHHAAAPNVTISINNFYALLYTFQQSNTELFQRVLLELRASTPFTAGADVAADTAAATAAAAAPSANFTQCTASFYGDHNEFVVNFIAAVEIYKSCLRISDENAL